MIFDTSMITVMNGYDVFHILISMKYYIMNRFHIFETETDSLFVLKT